jgi:hypothetical protein
VDAGAELGFQAGTAENSVTPNRGLGTNGTVTRLKGGSSRNGNSRTLCLL